MRMQNYKKILKITKEFSRFNKNEKVLSVLISKNENVPSHWGGSKKWEII